MSDRFDITHIECMKALFLFVFLVICNSCGTRSKTAVTGSASVIERSDTNAILSAVEKDFRSRWTNVIILIEPSFHADPNATLTNDTLAIKDAERGLFSAAILRKHAALMITNRVATVKIESDTTVKRFGLGSGLLELVTLERNEAGDWLVTSVKPLLISDNEDSSGFQIPTLGPLRRGK
jgi:hypothetical protein